MSDGGSTSSAARRAAASTAASESPSRSRISSAARRRTGIGPAPAVTSRAEAQRPPPCPTTMAAIPTIAKSPWRRLNSSKAKPAPSGIAGSRISTSISSAASVVVR